MRDRYRSPGAEDRKGSFTRNGPAASLFGGASALVGQREQRFPSHPSQSIAQLPLGVSTLASAPPWQAARLHGCLQAPDSV